jgi:hypothetical protein
MGVLLFVQFDAFRKSTPDAESRINILTPFSDITVYVDQDKTRVKKGEADGVYTLTHVGTDAHQITIAREGALPWTKSVRLRAEEVRTLAPFLLPTDTSLLTKKLSPENASYTHASELLKGVSAPTRERPHRASSGRVALFVEDNQALAQWLLPGVVPPRAFCYDDERTDCVEEISFFELKGAGSISMLGTLSQESYAFIVLPAGIFLIDIGVNESPQNFQPLFLSQTSRLVETTSTDTPIPLRVYQNDYASLFVGEGEDIFLITLP